MQRVWPAASQHRSLGAALAPPQARIDASTSVLDLLSASQRLGGSNSSRAAILIRIDANRIAVELLGKSLDQPRDLVRIA